MAETSIEWATHTLDGRTWDQFPEVKL